MRVPSRAFGLQAAGVLALAACLLIGSCGGRTPEKTFEGYLACLALHDIQNIRRYVCENHVYALMVRMDSRRAMVYRENAALGLARKEVDEFNENTDCDFSGLCYSLSGRGPDCLELHVSGAARLEYPDGETFEHRFGQDGTFVLVREQGDWKVCDPESAPPGLCRAEDDPPPDGPAAPGPGS
ncbi:MAG: hypothetical protein PHV85_08575 [Desulfovibrionaceae bacterium]|nr:hypothetical protein [Desulfovibrionaceae bacterium]